MDKSEVTYSFYDSNTVPKPPESCGLTARMVERNAGTRKVGIHRQELSSSLSKDTATRKNTTITPFRIL
jgi:hypothetical protein